MKQSIRLGQGLLVCSLLLASVLFSTSCDENPNFVVNSASVCSCEASIEGQCFVIAENWKHTSNNLLEVSARDFTNGDFIGTKCEGEPGPVTNVWEAVDGFQYNMAGTLNHFNWSYDGDEDWNIHVIPNPFFSFLIDDVEALHDESKSWHKKCGEPRCMETEVSPDKQFWSNPWFFAPGVRPEDTESNGYSWLEGRQMGFYGPWVMDKNHSSGSEIHPVHMMWFKDHFAGGFGGSGPFDIFWLMFLQDNTGRFDDRDDFDCGGAAPAWWKPWTDAPRSGQLNIAFEVNPTSEVVSFYIEELFKRFVVTSQDANARPDADNGTSHGLEFNGRVVVRVEEGQPNDNDLGVTFTNLCLGSDGKLRGFVSIRSKIGGNDDRDEEGFHILYATRSVRKTRPDVVAPDIGNLPVLLITSDQVGGSLGTDGNHFTGDLQLTLHGNDRTTDPDYAISKIEFAGHDIQRELRFEQNKQAKEVLIRDLPLVRDGRITVTSSSGLTLKLRTPNLSPTPGIQETITRSAIDAEAGSFLSASVGGIPGASVPKDKQLSALQELQLKFLPGYAPYDGNEVMTDTLSAFASDLNQAIAKNDRMKLEKLFNSAQPFTLAWTFEATNLATGKPVAVYTDKSGSEGVQVELMSGNLANDTLKIKFPSPGSSGIIELRAKATVTDTKGKTAVAEHHVWSHGFQSASTDVDEWAPLIQALSGLKDRSGLIAPGAEYKPREFSLVPDNKTRRKHIIAAYLGATVRDRQITIEELRNIIRALKKFSAI